MSISGPTPDKNQESKLLKSAASLESTIESAPAAIDQSALSPEEYGSIDSGIMDALGGGISLGVTYDEKSILKTAQSIEELWDDKDGVELIKNSLPLEVRDRIMKVAEIFHEEKEYGPVLEKLLVVGEHNLAETLVENNLELKKDEARYNKVLGMVKGFKLSAEFIEILGPGDSFGRKFAIEHVIAARGDYGPESLGIARGVLEIPSAREGSKVNAPIDLLKEIKKVNPRNDFEARKKKIAISILEDEETSAIYQNFLAKFKK